MIDFQNIRKHITAGLREYLHCQVIRGNQTAKLPDFPYCVYNITALASENNGSYGSYADGSMKKPVTLTMSFTTHSNDYTQAVELASKAREWLDIVGTTYLNDRDIIIQSVGSVSDRSNFLTSEYIYSYGFDFFVVVFDEISGNTLDTQNGEIATATISPIEYSQEQTYEQVQERLDNLELLSCEIEKMIDESEVLNE